MFYTATVNSGLTFGLACWGGNASIQNKNSHDRSIKKAGGGGVMGRRLERVDTAYQFVTNKLRTALADETHPLRPEFYNRHMDRSHRFRIPRS